MKPLNGQQTHPLSKHAREVLDGLRITERPCSMINPGVVDRLLRGGLAELVQLRSPFPTHAQNQKVQHLRITDAGRAALSEGASQ